MNELKYAMYVRKSSESEDRQALSPESQINENNKLAETRGIKIVDIFQESKSAKQPGRDQFARMIAMINKNEIQGIICWSLDRLARNPIDGGAIMWAMQQGNLKHILTNSSDHYPTDNVLVMQVHFGMANQFVIDLSKNTKRGLRAKAEMGYPHSCSKIGFINDYGIKGEKGLVVDQERLPLIKKMFEYYLTGNYSVRQIHDIAKNKLGLTTVPRKKLGGKPLSASTVNNVLKDPFYAGFFYHGGIRYTVHKDLPRLISEEEHHLICNMLQDKKAGGIRPKVNIKTFAYTGRMKCEFCTCNVTAEQKLQLICSECKTKFAYAGKTHCPSCNTSITKLRKPKYLHYKYYHCTRKKHDLECKEKSITESDIDNQLWNFYKENLYISPALADWCIEQIDQISTEDETQKKEAENALKRQMRDNTDRMDKLIDMKMKDLLSDEEFRAKKEALTADNKRIGMELTSEDELALKRKNKAIKTLSIMGSIESIIKNGSTDEKKDLLSIFGSNLTLKDKKVSVYNDETTSLLIKNKLEIKKKNPGFEPELIFDVTDSNPAFQAMRPTLLRG